MLTDDGEPCTGCVHRLNARWPRIAVCMLGTKYGQPKCPRSKRPEPPKNRPGSDLVLRMRGAG